MSIHRRINMTRFTREIAEQVYKDRKDDLEQALVNTGQVGYHIIFGTMDGEILFEASVNRDNWPSEFNYQEIATGKFEATVRTGKTMGDLLDNYPDLLERQDPQWRGNAKKGQVLVSISGYSEKKDESEAQIAANDFHTLAHAA